MSSGIDKSGKFVRMTACELSRIAAYSLGGGRAYNIPIIRWHLAEHTPDMDAKGNIEAFRGAFEPWARALSPIQLISTSNIKEANIVIRFGVNGDPDLPIPFSSSTLAYAYFPVRNKSDMWVNDRYNWGLMHRRDQYNLKKVVTHEIGHSLNIGHSSVKGDIMEAIYAPNNAINLTHDTLAAIERLYGAMKRRLGPAVDPAEPEKPLAPLALGKDGKKLLGIILANKQMMYRLSNGQLSFLAKYLETRGRNRRDTIDKTYNRIRSAL